jgi:hypothetical protein
MNFIDVTFLSAAAVLGEIGLQALGKFGARLFELDEFIPLAQGIVQRLTTLANTVPCAPAGGDMFNRADKVGATLIG